MGTTSYSATRTGQRIQAMLRSNLNLASRQAASISRALNDVAGLGREIQAVPLNQLLAAIGLPGVPMPSLARARGCRLPDCDCPPSDLGDIRRVVDRPERVEMVARFRNRSEWKRDFAIEASAMVSHTGEPGGAVAVEPAHLSLEPGEIAVVKLVVDAGKHRPGVDYDATLRFRAKGCEDLTLGVTVHVETLDDMVPLVDLHCCCRPKQRPLRWYHHYYCDPPADARTPKATQAPITDGPQRPVEPARGPDKPVD
jgi:hypothetical protein